MITQMDEALKVVHDHLEWLRNKSILVHQLYTGTAGTGLYDGLDTDFGKQWDKLAEAVEYISEKDIDDHNDLYAGQLINEALSTSLWAKKLVDKDALMNTINWIETHE
jgi:hypothetical protein